MKKFIIPAVILLIAITAAVYLIFLNKPKSEKNQFQPDESVANAGVDVKTVIAQKGEISKFITTRAKMYAITKGEIKSLVSSVVKSILINEGELVDKGDLLVKLDTQHIQNELSRCRAEYIKAVSKLMFELSSSANDSISNLWQKYQMNIAHAGKIPSYPEPKTAKEIIMLSRLNVQSTYNQVKEAELTYQHCDIRAPFSGIVSNVNIYPGAQVSAGHTICSLTDLFRMKLVIDILEEDIQSIEIGSPVLIEGYESKPLTITTILPQIQQDQNTGQALAYCSNPGFLFKDGQTIQAQIRKQLYEDRLMVPREALLNRNERDLVFVVQNGLAKWRYVDIGVGNSEYVEILKGVQPGDSVIVEGHYSLGHDVKVNPI